MFREYVIEFKDFGLIDYHNYLASFPQFHLISFLWIVHVRACLSDESIMPFRQLLHFRESFYCVEVSSAQGFVRK